MCCTITITITVKRTVRIVEIVSEGTVNKIYRHLDNNYIKHMYKIAVYTCFNGKHAESDI